jgi:hypothetical protein
MLKLYSLFFQVAPPILHINLGVFQRLYDCFEKQLHRIDLLLLKERALAFDPDEENATLFEK